MGVVACLLIGALCSPHKTNSARNLAMPDSTWLSDQYLSLRKLRVLKIRLPQSFLISSSKLD